jgi:hypothetical protein
VRSAAPPGAAVRARDSASKDPRAARSPALATTREERYRAAKRLLAGAERNQQRFGVRWSDRDLERFAAEDRELLQRSRDPADHSHRAGYERAQFEALRGDERERAEAEIEKARRRDLKRVTLTSEPPGRVVGRGRVAAERVRQGLEGAGGERRRRLRALRRERRLDQTPERRYLSRGARWR